MEKDKVLPGFGKRLMKIRKHLKMKQVDFSQKLGLSVTRISEIENDKSHPGFQFLFNLDIELNVNLHYLLSGDGEMFNCPRKVGTEQENVRKKIFSFEEAVKQLLSFVEDKREREFLRNFFGSDIVKYSSLSNYSELLIEKSDKIKMQLEKSSLDDE